ncbi:DNA polymerase III subunit gamma/tau [Microbacterium halophytorum]|uniref:DNA polymerase III subunit gamma/tau n=1 Tax=Microbacterium halophytorum TaxID=2067568 RepID=UPI000CFDCD13|nr:DNA polymerase III subunit gamma/tau [Microbacterium halophytorum]
MSRPDDALSWDGDDDPTLSVGPDAEPSAPEASEPVGAGAPPEPTPRAAEEEPAAGEDSSAPADEEAVPSAGPRRMGDVALVAVGLLGGVYALWTVGWVLGTMRLQVLQGQDAMFLGSMALGIAAPAVWFVAAWVLTAGRATWVRFAWLIAGVIILVPWPFVMVGVIGR